MPLSRSGASSPLGKLTFQAKVNLPEETGEILSREARRLVLSLSEFLRDALMVRAHGLDYVRSLYDSRLQSVAGTGTELGQRNDQ